MSNKTEIGLPAKAKNRKERVRTVLHTAFALSMWSVFERLPMRWASAIGGFVAARLLFHLPFTRHLRTNTALLFPTLSESDRNRLVRRMLWNVGRTFAEYPHLEELTNPDKSWVTIKGWDIYDEIRRDGRPAIFVSGHLANWELTAGSGARRGMPVTVVYAARRGEWLDRRVHRYRKVMQCGLTARGDAARPIVKRLMHKECIGLIVDQRADDGVMVPFFGRPAPTTSAPARLAIKFDAVIVPVECRRIEGTRFEITLHRPIRPEDYRHAPDPIYAITVQMNQCVEAWIRAHPQDWLCRRRRWAKKKA